MATHYYTASSLDGFIADPDNGLEWLFVQDIDHAGPMSSESFFAGIGAMCMGATTYEWVLAHDKWSYTTPTWVFTHRDLPVASPDVRLTQADVREVHAEMTEAAGAKDIWVAGGGDLVGSVRRRGAARPGLGAVRARSRSAPARRCCRGGSTWWSRRSPATATSSAAATRSSADRLYRAWDDERVAGYPFLKGHGTENDFVLLPDANGRSRRAVGRAGGAAVRPAGGDRRRRRDPGGPDRRGRDPARRAGEAPSGSWTTATPTARSARCAATGSGCSPGSSPTEGHVDPRNPLPIAHARRGQDAHLRRRPDHRRHGPARGARRDQRHGGGAQLGGPPRQHGQPARRRVRRGPRRRRARPARGARPRRGALPRRRERRVRRPARRAPRRACACTSAGPARPDRAAPARAR